MPAQAGTQQPRVHTAKESLALADASALDPRLRGDDKVVPRNANAARNPRMIPRYARPEMMVIWSAETKYRIWFEIEAHAADAMTELGVIPKDAAKTIWEKGRNAGFDVE